MPNKKPKKRYISKLKNKYRLSVYNDQSFEEVWVMRLSRLNILAFVGGITLTLIVIITVLIAFTPIREFIPGYPDGSTRRQIIHNTFKTDSLERELQQWKIYMGNLHTILRGGSPDNLESIPDTSIRYRELNFARSIEDSLLRLQIESEEMYNLSLVSSASESSTKLTDFHFFPPIKGVITSSFKAQHGHLGVDVVAPPNEVVVATADGTVVFSNWTLETGYVIQIQHANNLLSIYKHNSKLLKKSGARVKAGEAIAIIGNSGELTSGPHLHFELWHNGSPINPEQYIVF